jgi:hypothetical protein
MKRKIKRLRLEDDNEPRRKRERLHTHDEDFDAQIRNRILEREQEREAYLRRRYADACAKVRRYQQRVDECVDDLKDEFGIDLTKRASHPRPPKPKVFKPASADFTQTLRNLGSRIPHKRRCASRELSHMFKPMEDS